MHAIAATDNTTEGWRSVCECGWESKPLIREDAARDAHQVHVTLMRLSNDPRASRRRPPKRTVLTQMEPDLFDRLKDRAEVEGRSRASVMREALRRYLTERPRIAL